MLHLRLLHASCLILFSALSLTRVGYASDAEKLTWAPPELENPIVLKVSNEKNLLWLKEDQDYIIEMPDTPVRAKMGVKISNGRNVVLIGGAIEALPESEMPDPKDRRGLYLSNQTGIIHIEGLHIMGADLTEGIQLDQNKGGTVQLQNIRVETVHGSYEGWHADVVQTWALSEGQLRIDKLTGYTGYQGLFLTPNQRMEGAPPPKAFDLRRINIQGNEDSQYLLWAQIEPPFPLKVEDVWVDPPSKRSDRDLLLWPKPKRTGDQSWEAVRIGIPPGGAFVPEGVAGPDYVSPGYLDKP